MKDIIGELKQIALNAIFRLEEADSLEITDRKQFILGLRSAANVIINMPQPDVVEVVRCRDCKHSAPNGVYGCTLERFSAHDKSERLYSEDYCSCGERKDD